ncbi:MAG: hypothetical protein V1798_10565 [Pseudomonadota bacterium]
MKLNILTGLFLAFAASVAFAQPPEEVPPPPEAPGTEVITPLAPALEPVAAPALAPIPVAEPVAPAPAKPVEDQRIKGLTLSPAVGFFPFGYDTIDITGDPEGARYFFELAPQVSMTTSFKTDSDKTIDFSGSYEFDWREYYNKATTRRDFLNEVVVSASVKWNPLISTSANLLFDYFFKSGTDESADNNIYVQSDPALKFTVNDQLNFKLGYQLAYVNLIDKEVSASGLDQASDAPSDLDEIERGSYTSTATGFDNWTAPSQDLFPGSATTAAPQASHSQGMLYNRLVLGTGYTPIKGTTLGFDYRYGFLSVSNNDNEELKWEHYFIPKITQALPWAGGTIALTDELRLRKYKFRTAASDPSALRQKFRNRITLAIDQDINSYMAFAAWYRFELGGSNDDNYDQLEKYNKAYMGIVFKF